MKKPFVKVLAKILVVITAISCLVSCSVGVEQLILSKTNITIREGETTTLVCTIIPNDATNKKLTWQSTDNSVAVVDSRGVVKAISSGTCMIIVSADGKSTTANITVNPKGPDFEELYNDLDKTYGWELGEDKSYLSADTNVYDLDDYTNSSILYQIEDINRKIGLPDSLYKDMINTTWSMGKQTESYESLGLTVIWTYHPDKGLEVTYRLISN